MVQPALGIVQGATQLKYESKFGPQVPWSVDSGRWRLSRAQLGPVNHGSQLHRPAVHSPPSEQSSGVLHEPPHVVGGGDEPRRWQPQTAADPQAQAGLLPRGTL